MVAMSWVLLCCSGEDVLRARVRSLGGAAEPEPAGAAELLQAVRANELLERVDLRRRADELEDDRVGADVRRAGADRLCEREQLRPLRRRGGDLDERELPLDRLAGRQLLHPQH